MTIFSEPPTRRRFLGIASAAVAGLALGGTTRPLLASELRSRRPLATFLSPGLDAEQLRALAKTAVDAAVAAGASYADIRIADARTLGIRSLGGIGASLGFDCSYGLRVCVDGVWGNGYGIDPTPEGVAETARTVTQNLRAIPAALRKARGTSGLIPMPAVTGEWHVPMQIDPFSVSPDDHIAIMGAYEQAIKRVRGANFFTEFRWMTETRVFASSEGSMVTQTLAVSQPMIWDSEVQGTDPTQFRDASTGWVGGTVVGTASAGFEITTGTALQEQFVAFAHEAVEWSRYPTVANFPIGRYDAVMDGNSVGALMCAALLPALSLERATDRAMFSSRASYLSPVGSTVATRFASPLLSLSADRSPPHLGAAKWDDEGVPTQTFPVIKEGKIVSYFATRRSVAALGDMADIPDSIRVLRGSAVAVVPTRPVSGTTSSIRMAPGPSHQSLDALIGTLDNGIVVRHVARQAAMNQTMSHGIAFLPNCYEVKKGKVARRILFSAMQFASKRLWNSLDDVGGETSMVPYTGWSEIGQPASLHFTNVVAPAARFRDVTLIDYNRAGAM